MSEWAQIELDEWVFAPLNAPGGEPVIRVALKRDWIVIESAAGRRWAKRFSITLKKTLARLQEIHP